MIASDNTFDMTISFEAVFTSADVASDNVVAVGVCCTVVQVETTFVNIVARVAAKPVFALTVVCADGVQAVGIGGTRV